MITLWPPTSSFLLLSLILASTPAAAAKNPATSGPPTTRESEAAYAAAIDKRSADIVDALSLSDAAQKGKVHEILAAQYRTLRDWHDANDSKLKAAAAGESADIRAGLKQIHDAFLAALAGAGLTPGQVDTVKDRMTYNKVKVTYDAYVQIVPNLSEDDKTRILEYLRQAREEAMDAGSAQEKSAVFKKYKGRINNDLSKHGHDVNQAYKDWGNRRKASPPATSRSATS